MESSRMTLSDLLDRLRPHLDVRGDYALVVGPRAGAGEGRSDDDFHPVVSAFAEDDSEELILRTSESPLADVREADRLRLKDLVERLETERDQRAAFEVEASSSGPDDGFRVDFPIIGTGWNDETAVFAFLW
jgi:hypothetical protein